MEQNTQNKTKKSDQNKTEHDLESRFRVFMFCFFISPHVFVETCNLAQCLVRFNVKNHVMLSLRRQGLYICGAGRRRRQP